MIELTREVVGALQSFVWRNAGRPAGMYAKVSRLSGTDGQAKMGKSLGNAIALSDDEAT